MYVAPFAFFGIASLGAALALFAPGMGDSESKWNLHAWTANIGSCWKCMVLSALSLAASAGALLTAIRWSFDTSIIVAWAVTTGLLMCLTILHAVMFVWRRTVQEREPTRASQFAEAPRRTCCGQSLVHRAVPARTPGAATPARKFILRSGQSPGDIVMLTAAVRDIQLSHPGHFLIDVRTPCPQLWENNPHLTPLDEADAGIEIIDCHYPLIHRSNQSPYHFVEGYLDFLNQKLGLHVRPAAFRGDIHVSALEKSWFSQIEEITGEPTQFWIVVAGGKWDYTIKWWDHHRYQEVIDHFFGKILFVQVGETGHQHPPLRGVIDLRGKTDLRQLVRLVYHSQGILCPVTLAMHLATAVEVKDYRTKNRPCVVIAGGREPPHWEAYPHHQYIHTVGALSCCDNGGCWKSRVTPLGDGDEKDLPGNACVDVVGKLPRCMDMITADEVIRRIEFYFQGGAIEYLTSQEFDKVQTAAALSG